MKFYDQIVSAYDELFPFNEKQEEFLINQLGKNVWDSNILDMGCGTGSLSISLARKGAMVRAFDFNEQMVAVAKGKKPRALNLKFQQGDMMKLWALFPSVVFDALVCFGNTLVHLNSFNDIHYVSHDAAFRLKKGGKFMFQIINYDRVVAKGVTALPTIDVVNYNLVRNYHQKPGVIGFETILTNKADGSKVVGEVPLLPLQRSEIEKMLASDFSKVDFFGGFDQTEWTEDSFHTIVVAEK